MIRKLMRKSLLNGAILGVLVALSACGGGGSGGGGGITAIKGQAIDAPISNATITLTLNAPLGQPGAQTLTTTTADSSGNFTLNVSLPSTSAPVFANAQSGTTLLSSYLGPASSLSSLAQLSTTNVPNLAISQVTTAALAILAASNQLSTLTPSSYATLLTNHRSDIIAAAAGIMAVVDAGCSLPSGDADTFEMTKNLVANTSAVSTSNSATPTLTSVSSGLVHCSSTTLQQLLQAISASQLWAPQLDLGDVVENTASVVSSGTYHLQGLLADTGISQNNPASTMGSVSSPSPFDDTAVTVSPSGAISSHDQSVSGQVYGNYLTLTVTTGGESYSFQGKVGILPSAFLSTGSGYSLRTAGPDGAGNLVKFDAVLVPQNATPNWGGISGSSEDGTSCSSGFGFRIHGLGPEVGGYVYSLCGSVSNSTPNLSVSSGGSEDDEFNNTQPSSPSPFTMSLLSSGATSYPYILNASNVSLASQTGGSLYFVMGANEFFFNFGSSPEYNGSFLMNENPLDKLAENSQGSDH
jgi:hypothetical protein